MAVQRHKYSFMISGGGTGGHIFPALAIADALKAHYPDAEFHFVGALQRMEMEKIPQHGYNITGLPIAGLNRTQLIKNLNFPFKLIKSIAICRKLLSAKRPNVVIGTGGFASGPLLWQAQKMGIPTLIQEQNSYPGITNKLLGKKANVICVAYAGLERWFPKEKISLTGNPVREGVLKLLPETAAARESFGLTPTKPTIVVLGGSLGARAINQAIYSQLDQLLNGGAQILWQCGKLYAAQYSKSSSSQVSVQPFISDMSAAYAAADVIISRAGASTLSELAIIGKPAILIPSPNVAEDHQTHNARAFANKGAAILLPEVNSEELANKTLSLLNDSQARANMHEALQTLARPNATEAIVKHIKTLLQ